MTEIDLAAIRTRAWTKSPKRWDDLYALCREVERLRRVTDIIDPESVHREQRDEALAKVTRLRAAITELVTHGDLTPTGRDVLNDILGGE